MRAKRSAFDAWFREQFGAPFRLRDRRFAQEQAALTAWNARGKNDAL